MSRLIIACLTAFILTGCNLTTQNVVAPSETHPPTRTLTFQDANSTTEIPAVTESTIQPDLASPVNSEVSCKPQSSWEEYTIQRGDNLTKIANKTRSTVDELIAANCMDDPNRIRVGQVIFVPNLPQE